MRNPFWKYVERLTARRALFAGAVVTAIFSAGSLGVGLVALIPIFKTLLKKDDTGGLRAMASEWAAEAGVALPAWLTDLLPVKPYHSLLFVIIGVGILIVLGGFANFLHQFVSVTLVQRVVLDVRREAFAHVVRLPLLRVIRGGLSDATSRIVADTGQLESGLSSLVSKALMQALKGVFALGAAFVAEWRVTLAGAVVAPIMYVLIRRLGKRIRSASKGAMMSGSGLFAATLETLQSLRLVKVFNAEPRAEERFERHSGEMMRQVLRARTARAIASPLVESLTLIALGGLFLIVAKAILDNVVSAEAALAAMAALFAFGASLKPLTGLVTDIQASSSAADRLEEILSESPEPGHEPGLPAAPRMKESIEFRGVTFTYPGAESPALRSVNLRVRAGETVALVGPNGCGKTTLLSLLPRLFDADSGEVLIDGVDIRGFDVNSLRSQFGVVTQETVLLRDTVRANIALARANAGDAEVAAAAKAARADGFIERLPRGYDTDLGDQGLTLSGGQRQRIAIARAILRDPAILIMDEATSMIDADSERHINEAIADFSRGRTCLIVAHRLSTVMRADRIVVIESGRVLDEGRHAELLGRCALYRLLAQQQMVQQDEPGRPERGNGSSSPDDDESRGGKADDPRIAQAHVADAAAREGGH